MKPMRKLLLILALLGLAVSPAFAFPTWTATSALVFATDNNTSVGIQMSRDCKTSASLILPTLTSSTVAVHVSRDGTTYYPYYYNAGAAAAPALWLVGATTGGTVVELPQGVLDFQYIRFEFATEQAADRSLRVMCR